MRDFINLAVLQIRRELIDLARPYDGPEGLGRHHLSQAGSDGSGTATNPLEASADTNNPARLAAWTEFHTQVEALPDEEREVFNLLWYHGVPQHEAARLLGVTERVPKHRWRSATGGGDER
jgi:RNA polymerase sigma-70 factor (ECF subfamily)